jgi:hypothetical protein
MASHLIFSGGLVGGIGSSIARALLSAFAHAIGSGISSLAAWALSGLAHAASATTAINLDGWFQGPWRAMLTVGTLVAIPLFLAGILDSLAHGEGVAGLGRVVGRLLVAAIGTLVALALVELLLVLVDNACSIVEQTSGLSLGGALARLATAMGISTSVGGGALSAIGALLLALLAAIAAFMLWIELAVRSALILVATAFLPLGLAGLLWPRTASWLRRLGEIVVAVAISKLVIVVVLILGAAALTESTVSLSTPGADIDAMVNGVAFLGLATFGLPMALRVVPLAAEAAMHAGRGRSFVQSAVRAPSRLAMNANSTATLLQRVGSKRAGSAGGDGSGSGAAGGVTPPKRPGSGGGEAQ